MKNATKHAERFKSLIRSLMKDHKPHAAQPMDPLPAFVRGAMSFDVSDHRAEEAMKLINAEFVDLNELRVATELEIQELLGTRYPAIEKRVEMITRGLNHIFEREHTLSLDRLRTLPRREVRQFLRELPEIHPFVEAYVMLMAFDGAALPLDALMLACLQDHDVFPAETDLEDAQRFLEHQVKAEEMRDVYVVLRKAAAEGGAKKKAK